MVIRKAASLFEPIPTTIQQLIRTDAIYICLNKFCGTAFFFKISKKLHGLTRQEKTELH